MSYLIRRAMPQDNTAILDLVARTPQQGLLRLNFERDPDFHAGACVSCEDPDIWIAEHGDAPGRSGRPAPVVAVINIGLRAVYLNGAVRRLRYGHDLRIDPAHRGGMLLHRIFRRLRAELLPEEWMQTVILDGNDLSLSTVGSGRAGMPTYYPHGMIETHLVFTAGRRRPRAIDGIDVRRARCGDMPVMQAFLDAEGPRRQFFPKYDLGRLLTEDRYYIGLRPDNFLLAFDGDVLVGMAGDWDQSAFKRTRVLAYPGVLRWLRHGYNAWGALTGGMRLPEAGECFRYRSLHTVLAKDNDPHVFRALLDHSLAGNADCEALACAFFAGDPLTAALAKHRRRCMRSRHFLVCYGGDPRARIDGRLLPYVDVARL
ncbi:MAG: hypothetical protein ACLGHG_09615 [Gammaproteobacteria bacterium]